MKSIPEKTNGLFWDVKKDEVDVDLQWSYIIHRMMEVGNMDDVKLFPIMGQGKG